MEKWPNFFIVGASKSGTTTLFMNLEKFPEIYISPIKEPHYFSPNFIPYPLRKPIRDKKKYLKLFGGVKNEIGIGEASTDYLRDPKTPELIHQVVPNALIIAILRDPVERAYSHYLHNVRLGVESLSFSEVIQKCLKNEKNSETIRPYLEAGLYSEQVKRYLDRFPNEKVKIFIFEEFIKDVKNVLKQIITELGIKWNDISIEEDVRNPYRVSKGFLSKKILTSKSIAYLVNKSTISQTTIQRLREKYFEKRIKKPPMVKEERRILEEYYFDNVQKLKTVLGRDLPWSWANKE